MSSRGKKWATARILLRSAAYSSQQYLVGQDEFVIMAGTACKLRALSGTTLKAGQT